MGEGQVEWWRWRRQSGGVALGGLGLAIFGGFFVYTGSQGPSGTSPVAVVAAGVLWVGLVAFVVGTVLWFWYGRKLRAVGVDLDAEQSVRGGTRELR